MTALLGELASIYLSHEDRGVRTLAIAALAFEREGFGVNKPGAWRRLYTTMPGYCREFGWRACFLGGGE